VLALKSMTMPSASKAATQKKSVVVAILIGEVPAGSTFDPRVPKDTGLAV